MANKASWRLAIIAALVAVAGLLVHAGLVALDSPRPAAPPEQAPAAAPSAPSAPPDAQEPPPATVAERPDRQMQMTQATRAYTPSSAVAADYSYSLRQQRNERTILPGVTIGPGKTLNVKTANKDENIRITRDSAYPSSDYQVLWQKKY